jgi:hypothetical protein
MSTAEERFEAIMLSVLSIDYLSSMGIPYEVVFKIQKNVILGILEDMNSKFEKLQYEDFWGDFDSEAKQELALLEGTMQLLVYSFDTFGARFVDAGEFVGQFNLYEVEDYSNDWWNY